MFAPLSLVLRVLFVVYTAPILRGDVTFGFPSVTYVFVDRRGPDVDYSRRDCSVMCLYFDVPVYWTRR